MPASFTNLESEADSWEDDADCEDDDPDVLAVPVSGDPISLL